MNKLGNRSILQSCNKGRCRRLQQIVTNSGHGTSAQKKISDLFALDGRELSGVVKHPAISAPGHETDCTGLNSNDKKTILRVS